MLTASTVQCSIQRHTWHFGFLIVLIAAALGGSYSAQVFASEPGSAEPPSRLSNVVLTLPKNKKSNDSQWIYKSEPRKRIALVFIHGLGGTVAETWTNKKTKKTFFHYILDSDIRDEVDIFAFGYPSGFFEKKPININEAANLLISDLDTYNVLDYQNLVLIGHSMGGLVAMRAVVAHNELRDKVPLIVLYATPQEGSHLANVADYLRYFVSVPDLRLADESTFLQGLLQDWKNLALRPAVSCGYETKSTFGIMVVPWSSSTRVCLDELEPLPISGANHTDIVKPDRAQHQAVSLLSNSVSRFILSDEGPTVTLPDFELENGRYVYRMAKPRVDVRVGNNGRRPVQLNVKQVSSDAFAVLPDKRQRLMPDDRTSLTLALFHGWKDPEYSFVLQFDDHVDKEVLVKVAVDLVQAESQAWTGYYLAQLSKHLDQPEVKARLAILPADSDAGRHEQALVAYNALTEKFALDSVKTAWVLAADTLSAAGLTEAARVAIHKANATSSGSPPATTPQGMYLPIDVGGFQSANATGVLGGFYFDASQPIYELATHTRPDFLSGILQAEDTSNIGPIQSTEIAALKAKLARQFKNIPALRADGLTLEGDNLLIVGKTDDALAAYRASVLVSPNSSARNRLAVLDPTYKPTFVSENEPDSGPGAYGAVQQAPPAGSF